MAARSPRPARPSVAVGAPAPTASRVSPPPTSTTWPADAPWTTLVGRVASGFSALRTAVAVSSLVVEAGVRGEVLRLAYKTCPVSASTTDAPPPAPNALTVAASRAARTAGDGV